MNRLPIRWKLTLWYAVVLVVILTLFSVVLARGLTWRLQEQFDHQLLTQAQTLASTIDSSPRLDELDLDDDTMIAVVDRQGRDQLEGDDDDEEEHDGEAPTLTRQFDRALRGDTTILTMDGEEGPMRVAVVPIAHDDDRIEGALAIGASLSDLNRTLSTIRTALALVTLAAAAIAIGAGYFLAARVLQPVRDITSLAASIDEDDLGARLRLDLPRDELGSLADTLNGMLDRIERAFVRQQRFTSDAAHELRTPVALLRSEADVALARDRSPEEYRHTLGAMRETLDRMGRLTGSLLTLARLDAHRHVRRSESVAVDATLADVVETLQPMAEDAGVAIRTDLQPVNIVGNSDVLIQVAVNLLTNAISYTPLGGTVTVRCRPTEEGVTWSVTDTGIGIPEDVLPRIFDRFFRPDEDRARTHGGSGLGLAICDALIRAEGGSIAATSRVGEGSTFTVRMPAANRPG